MKNKSYSSISMVNNVHHVSVKVGSGENVNTSVDSI